MQMFLITNFRAPAKIIHAKKTKNVSQVKNPGHLSVSVSQVSEPGVIL